MVKNHLDRTLARIAVENRSALVAYLAAGYPSFAEEEKLIVAAEQAGVDVLELGIPFSDPVADGPTIQFASQESLKRGTTLRKILPWVGRLTRKVRMPVVLMGYLNPIVSYGEEAFARDAARAGVTGVIVPDLVPEESAGLRKALTRRGVHLIHLVAPTTPPDRQRRIARQSGGFLYAVSVAGVTGARKSLPPETRAWLKNLRRMSRTPVCVGFGISGVPQVRALRGCVDGFIVGSALIDIIRKNKTGRRIAEASRFLRGLAKECSRGR